jgi:hypothetical protein
VEGGVDAGAVADLVAGYRVEELVDQTGWVIILLWEAGGGVFVGKGDNRDVTLGVGQPRDLGPKERGKLDFIATACLVAEGLEPDLGAGDGGGLSKLRFAPSCRATGHGFR